MKKLVTEMWLDFQAMGGVNHDSGMQKIFEHFRQQDPILFRVMQEIGPLAPIKPAPPERYFSDLCEAILSQQLSDKVAMVIIERFKKLFPKQKITPKRLTQLKEGEIRSVGTSFAKIAFMKDLSQKVLSRELVLTELQELPDGLVGDKLTRVKGIGPWTSEMFLIFTLGRPDVFSHGDLGLRRAIQKLYSFKREPKLKAIEKIVQKWTPHKTTACRYLWRSLEIPN